MASPFSNPEIQARIHVEVFRINSARTQWIAEPTGDSDSLYVECAVDTLDAYARGYLEAVDGNARLPEYLHLVRSVASELVKHAQKHYLSNPYSDDRLRYMAENAGDFIMRKRSLTPAQQEEELRKAVESLRSHFMPDAIKWSSWEIDMFTRIVTRLEARHLYWKAEAIERALRDSKTRASEPGGAEPAPAQPATMANGADRGSTNCQAEVELTAKGQKQKRGPKPDHEAARRVAEVVARLAPDGDWCSKVDDICDEFDEKGIPSPRKWKTETPSCRNWVGQLDRQKVIKVIKYRLATAKQQSEAAPKTLA